MNVPAKVMEATKKLVNAAKTGDLEQAKLAINEGAHVKGIHKFDINSSEAYTPLMWACVKGNLEMTRCLIAAGANEGNIDAYATVYVATKTGNLAILKLLRENGAKFNFRVTWKQLQFWNEVPMSLLRKDIKTEISQYLIAGWHKDLLEAAANGDFIQIDSAIKSGCDINFASEDGKTFFEQAASFGWADIVRRLIEAGADIDKSENNGVTALTAATKQGHLNIVKLLVENGANVNKQNADGSTPLICGIKKGDLKTIKYLAKNGANLNKSNREGTTPLCAAVKKQNLKVVEFLLNGGAHLTVHTALLPAVTTQNLAIIKLLLKEKANVNFQCSDRGTPLLQAIEQGNAKVVELLLENGADPNVIGVKNALAKLSQKDKTEIVKLLVRSGADLDVVTESGQTSLTKYVQMGNVVMARAMINTVKDLNQVDKIGKTVLSIAASNFDISMVDVLIQAGADMECAKKELDVFAQNDPNFQIYLMSLRAKQRTANNASATLSTPKNSLKRKHEDETA